MRTDINGNYRNSAPCLHCFKVIAELCIKKIIFSTDTDFTICKTVDYQTTHISNGNRFLKGAPAPFKPKGTSFP